MLPSRALNLWPVPCRLRLVGLYHIVTFFYEKCVVWMSGMHLASLIIYGAATILASHMVDWS